MPREMGPNEEAARATLPNRLAARYDALSRGAQDCFSGLFNGAFSTGRIWGDDNLSIGKAESEWGWRETWAELQGAGLISWRTETVDAPGDITGKMTKVHWSVTDEGWAVREDDLAYFNELMDAMKSDHEATKAEAKE